MLEQIQHCNDGAHLQGVVHCSRVERGGSNSSIHQEDNVRNEEI